MLVLSIFCSPDSDQSEEDTVELEEGSGIFDLDHMILKTESPDDDSDHQDSHPRPVLKSLW